MKIQLLNILFAVLVVSGGPGEAFGRIPIPKPVPVPDPLPVPVPRPGPDPVPVPQPKPDPIPNVPDMIPAAEAPDGDYPLGRYTDNNQAPFQGMYQVSAEKWKLVATKTVYDVVDLAGEWDPFFSKVDDILAAAETAKINNDAIPNNGVPHGKPMISTVTEFQTHCSILAGGRSGCVSVPTTSLVMTVFDATQPTKACEAWSSLSVYCGGGGTECACYSGTYYVPDQWNTLAAVCAQAVITTESPSSSSSAQLSTSAPSMIRPPTRFPAISFASISFAPVPTMFPDLPTIPTVPGMPPALPPRQVISATATEAEDKDPTWLADLAEAASSYATYCPTDTPTVAFGAATPTPSDDSAPRPGTNMFQFKILSLALGAIWFTLFDIW